MKRNIEIGEVKARSHSRLTCENLISIDPTAITTNFRIISEQLEVLDELPASTYQA